MRSLKRKKIQHHVHQMTSKNYLIKNKVKKISSQPNTILAWIKSQWPTTTSPTSKCCAQTPVKASHHSYKTIKGQKSQETASNSVLGPMTAKKMMMRIIRHTYFNLTGTPIISLATRSRRSTSCTTKWYSSPRPPSRNRRTSWGSPSRRTWSSLFSPIGRCKTRAPSIVVSVI